MTQNILIAVELIGSLILVGSYGNYRRGPAEPWANRTLLYGALLGLCYALIGALCDWYSFGLSKKIIAALAVARHGIGGVAVGLFISLILSGQLWIIGSRKKYEETK